MPYDTPSAKVLLQAVAYLSLITYLHGQGTLICIHFVSHPGSQASQLKFPESVKIFLSYEAPKQ